MAVNATLEGFTADRLRRLVQGGLELPLTALLRRRRSREDTAARRL